MILIQAEIDAAYAGDTAVNTVWTAYKAVKTAVPERILHPQKAADISPERIENEKRLMDCMDCHNRPTHIFRSPEELIDTALAQGGIDSSLPFIKREGLKALNPPNPSLAQAITRVQAVKEFYLTSYPQVYQEKETAIVLAVDELTEIARLTTFPKMKIT